MVETVIFQNIFHNTSHAFHWWKICSIFQWSWCNKLHTFAVLQCEVKNIRHVISNTIWNDKPAGVCTSKNLAAIAHQNAHKEKQMLDEAGTERSSAERRVESPWALLLGVFLCSLSLVLCIFGTKIHNSWKQTKSHSEWKFDTTSLLFQDLFRHHWHWLGLYMFGPILCNDVLLWNLVIQL